MVSYEALPEKQREITLTQEFTKHVLMTWALCFGGGGEAIFQTSFALSSDKF